MGVGAWWLERLGFRTYHVGLRGRAELESTLFLGVGCLRDFSPFHVLGLVSAFLGFNGYQVFVEWH